MAHGGLLKYTISTIFLLLIVDFARGQVGTCSGTGCSCTGTYACCLQIQENAARGSIVGSVDIISPFNNSTPESTFSIMSLGDVDLGLFNINSSGLLTVDQSADREDDQQGDCLRIAIQFRQSPETVLSSLLFAINIIDENDNAPTFSASELQLTVDETTGNEILICTGIMRSTLLASDVDAPDSNNSAVHYRIADGLGSDTFSVPEPTEPCIENIVELDRETMPNYTCTLIAEDRGLDQLSSSAIVTFVLLDVNDNNPEFINPPLELTIPEDESIGYFIHQFEASDLDLGINREIQYSISSTVTSLPFSINATTGELFLISTLSRRDTPIRIIISATDRGIMPRTGTTEVTITVLDRNTKIEFVPTFYPGSIEENSLAPIDIIGVIGTDSDEEPNTVINATLESGQQFFDVRITTAMLPNSIGIQIGVFQSQVIDREIHSTVDIVLRIEEGVDPLFVEYVNHTINITDVNDNHPELRETNFELVEEANTNTFIGFLGDAAFDLDLGNNGTVGSYRLQSVISEDAVDLTQMFLSANEEGNLRPNGRLFAPTIDREEVGTFITCIVLLTDMGQPNQTTRTSFTVQILDINDHFPEFESSTYEFTLMENLPRLEPVGRVVATDPDNGENGTVTYEVDAPGDFIIDSEGLIMSDRSFDRETTAVHTITITARDNGPTQLNSQGMSPTTTVTITIGDENDNPPMFTETPEPFTVESNRQTGYRIFDFSTIVDDPDAFGPSNTLLFNLSPNEYFTIDESSGILSVNNKLQITEVPFDLTVTACNNGSDTKLQDSIDISITVVEAFPILIVGASSGSAAFILILIAVVCIVLACICCKNRRGKFVVTEESSLNNQTQKPILKTVPAEPAALLGDRRGRVKFSGKVEETHYDYEQAVGDSSVYRKQSTTNFGSGSSDESPATPPRVHHNGNVPVEGINGDVPPHLSHFNMQRTRQRSPLVYRTGLSTDVEIHEYSQGENSMDGNSDDESTYSSDDASNMNTSIPCFQGDDHGAELRYPPQLHSHIHQAEPPPSHLANLHHNYHHAQYPPSPHEELTLTPQQNGSVSSPSHSHTPTHAPIPSHQMLPTLEAPPRRVHGVGSRSYPHPLVMPDAYPRGTPEMPGYGTYMNSYQSDYDTSTYASTELDEALGFHVDTEPGFYSLTATDCDDHEDTQL